MGNHYQTGADLWPAWQADVTSGRPPVTYPVGMGDLAGVPLAPGRVLLIGGGPGVGKTCLSVQMVFDALRLTPGLRAVVCNVEMHPTQLLDRTLARLARVSLTSIRGRRLAAGERAAVDAGLAALRPLADRVAFVGEPYSLADVAAAADATDARLVLLDYVQRLAPPGDHREKRTQVEATMGLVRRFADRRRAVIAVAAVGRSKDAKGRNSYAADTLSLGSFRESSELEYGCDDAYILCPAASPDGSPTLRHLKSRYGECQDIPLAFHKPFQLFTPFGT